jgi:basic membrane protein A
VHITDPGKESSGYAYAHETGIREMMESVGLDGGQLIEKVQVDDADAMGIENAMRDLIAGGVQIIFATSWGYMNTCEKLAGEFPGVIFAHATGSRSNSSNFTNYYGRVYQARYLSGIAAGLKTKTGKIGYVAAQGRDNSEVTGGINAFALGVEKANPGARIFVKVTYSWFDPRGEAAAARELIAQGCDVLAQHCDTPNPQLEAQKAGVFGIGYNSGMEADAPGAVLASVRWRWGVYYTSLVRSVLDGTFTSEPYFGSLKDGIVDMTPLSDLAGAAGPEILRLIAAERTRIESGEFDVFDGVLLSNDGREIGRAGARLSDGEIRDGMDWYYHTVNEIN